MTKDDLTKELAVSEKLHLSTAVKAVDGIMRIVKDALAKGESVTLRGFGTIAPVMREGAHRPRLQDRRDGHHPGSPHGGHPPEQGTQGNA